MTSPIVSSAEPVAEAARRFAAAVVAVDAELGWARVAVSGSVAHRVVPSARALIPDAVWSRLRLTWTDDAASATPGYGRVQAIAGGLDLTAVGVELPFVVAGESSEAAVKRIARRFADQFSGGIDVALLELGDDGSLAGLFPGHAARFSMQPVVHITDAPHEPQERLTLGFKSLRTARTHVILAEGTSKRAALGAISFGDPLAPSNVLPGEVVVVTDAA